MSSSLAEALLTQAEFSRKSRIPSLYSDFAPLQLSNRDGYEANISAWISALAGAIYNSRSIDAHVTIHANAALADALISHQWGKPLALPTIEREACARRAWVPCQTFLDAETSILAQPSFLSTVSLGGILSWGLSKVYTPSPPRKLSETRYVIVSNLKHLAQEVDKARTIERGSLGAGLSVGSGLYSDDMFTVESFTVWIEQNVHVRLTSLEMTILLKFMERDVHRLRVSGNTIKFGDSSVTEPDIAVAQLKSTIASLAAQVKALNALHANLSALLKTQINNKVLALSTLRRRKNVEARLETSLARQGECTALLDKIDESIQQLQTIEGMERASLALGSVLKQIGGLERVERVIEQVHEQNDQVEDIAQAMASSSLSDESVDEEYAALLAESEINSLKPADSQIKDLKPEPVAEAKQPPSQSEDKPIFERQAESSTEIAKTKTEHHQDSKEVQREAILA